jgi:hypothetical protein
MIGLIQIILNNNGFIKNDHHIGVDKTTSMGERKGKESVERMFG